MAFLAEQLKRLEPRFGRALLLRERRRSDDEDERQRVVRTEIQRH